MTPPWQVSASEFDADEKRLDIRLDFPRGSTFSCPKCEQSGLKAFDTVEKTWRHLNFFQHEACLTARVPRTRCDKCGTHLVNVPWGRSDSGFTLLFEAMIMTLAKSMPVKTIAQFVNEHDTRLWRVLHHYVDDAREKADHNQVKKVGMDETSRRRGHNYVSLFVDLDGPRVLFATDGKGASTVKRFKQNLIEHKGDPKAIEVMCCDMSPAFISGIEKQFPEAQLTFDRFHVMKVINDALDKVRRGEIKDRPELTGSRYVWLKNQKNLKPSQTELLDQLTIKEAAYTIKRHWNGVLRWFTSKINNGILEGVNSLIQAAKARAHGYRTKRNLITMIYLIAGKLNFDLPT